MIRHFLAIHSSKGLEFDHVQVHDDVVEMSRFTAVTPTGFEARRLVEMWAKSQVKPPCFQFLPSPGESELGRCMAVALPLCTPRGHTVTGSLFLLFQFSTALSLIFLALKVNLIYVALTRAKKILCLPASVANLIENLRAIDQHIQTGEERKESIRLKVMRDRAVFTWEEVLLLHQELVVPWKDEVRTACGDEGLQYHMSIVAPEHETAEVPGNAIEEPLIGF